MFQHDPNYAENEEKYQAVKKEILGSDAEGDSGSDGDDDGDESGSEEESEAEGKSNDVHCISCCRIMS